MHNIIIYYSYNYESNIMNIIYMLYITLIYNFINVREDIAFLKNSILYRKDKNHERALGN